MTETDMAKLQEHFLQTERRVILLRSVMLGWLQRGVALDRRRPREFARDAARSLVVQRLSHEHVTRLLPELFLDGQLDKPKGLTA